MRVRLSVLKEYFSFLLVEGRVDDAREKFPDIEEDDWQQLVANQPAGSNNKYLMWGAGQVDDGFSVEVVVQVIRLFDGHVHRLKQKDINQYKDVGEIEKAVDELGEKKTKSQVAKQARADTDTIYNDDHWLVVRPHTTESSQKYGVGTRWCIAATASRNYYKSYSESNNKFYFVIDKKQLDSKTPSSKYALAIISAGQSATGDRIQVYDASDKLVSMKTVADHVGDKWPEIWKKIEAHVKANPITREVEEAQKAVDEHVQALMKGDKVSETGLQQIASKGKLTTDVVKALIAKFDDYPAPRDWYQDKRSNIMSALSDRSDQLQPEAALAVMKWIASARPEGGSYWSGNYYLERMMTNANLPPEGFAELAATGDETILARLFTNPSCPEEVKKKIAEAVAKFKSAEAARQVYWELIKSGNITDEQFKQAMQKDAGERSGYGTVTDMILNHPEEVRLKPEMIRQLQVKDAHQLQQFMKLPNVPSDAMVAALTTLMRNKGLKKYDLYQTLRTVNLTTEDIESLWSNNKDAEARTAMLQNPAIGAGNAAKFAKSKNSAYRFAIAHNPVTPPAALEGLSTDESVSTRAAVAANTNTPAETLTRLAGDEATAVRASVASNDKAPRDILDALKRDSDEFIRKAARKTLKALSAVVATEALLRSMNNLMLIEVLNEAMDDDSTPDIMNPSWRDLPARSVDVHEFIAVYLLQNNGHATREEIGDAFQDWMGSGGSKELWQTNRYTQEIYRGSTSGGKGWYWSPPGINKGALFRLTPSGASAALEVLQRHKGYGERPEATVTSATARPGKTYYTPELRDALDITGYEKGEIDMEEVEVDRNGNPLKVNGKYQKLNPERSRRMKRLHPGTKMYKITMPSGEVKVLKELPKVQLPGNSAVVFVKNLYGLAKGASSYNRESNRAVVKHGDRFLVVNYPLWAAEGGHTPASKEKNVPPPVKKSSPASAEPTRAAGAARPTGPKVSYKIYGRKAGKPAHTRLKGQAYGAPADTQFTPGELAVLQATDDNKLKVKKIQGDHEQTWDPVEG
jgi:hypothetical protein